MFLQKVYETLFIATFSLKITLKKFLYALKTILGIYYLAHQMKHGSKTVKIIYMHSALRI